jgi:hypothetical protein
MPWPFITSEPLPKENTTLECKTKRTNNNHFQLTQRTHEEWAESHTALYTVQMITLNY